MTVSPPFSSATRSWAHGALRGGHRERSRARLSSWARRRPATPSSSIAPAAVIFDYYLLADFDKAGKLPLLPVPVWPADAWGSQLPYAADHALPGAGAVAALDRRFTRIWVVDGGSAQRLIVNGALAEIAGLGVEVHLRSIFLQGLLFLPPDRMPTALKGASGPLSRVRRMIAEGRSDPLQAALGFALSRPEASSVIVGVVSAGELQAVIAAAASPPPDLDWDEMALEDPSPLADKGWAAA